MTATAAGRAGDLELARRAWRRLRELELAFKQTQQLCAQLNS
jgi:hypothetical protein